MDDPFYLDRSEQLFEKVKNNPSVECPETLQILHDANRNYFNPSVINMIVELGSKSSIAFIDFVKYSVIMELPIFSNFAQYSQMDDAYHNTLSTLNVYFKAIALLHNVSYATIRQNVLFWIRSKVEQPINTSIAPKHCRVTVKSTYRPEESQYVTVYQDLIRKSTDQIKALANVSPQVFHYTPKNAPVSMMPNNVMNGIVSNLINLQTLMTREALAQNTKLPPFLDLVSDKRLEESQYDPGKQMASSSSSPALRFWGFVCEMMIFFFGQYSWKNKKLHCSETKNL